MPIAVKKPIRYSKRLNSPFIFVPKQWVGYAVKVIIDPDFTKLGFKKPPKNGGYTTEQANTVIKNMDQQWSYASSYGFDRAVVRIKGEQYVGREAYVVAMVEMRKDLLSADEVKRIEKIVGARRIRA